MSSVRLYPLHLPAALVAGHGFQPEPNARERVRDQGEMRMRPRWRSVPELCTVSWLYQTQQDFDDFDAWYEGDLQAGALDFDLRVQDRGTEFGQRWYTAQFVGDYRCEVFDALLYRVSATLRLIEDLGTLRIPPGIEAMMRCDYTLTGRTVAPTIAATIALDYGFSAAIRPGPLAATMTVTFTLQAVDTTASDALRETDAGDERETDAGIARETD